MLRLAPSTAAKERRLRALLGPDGALPGSAVADLRDAVALGSLELSGFRFSWNDVTADRRGEALPAEVAALKRAQAAVPADAPLDLNAFAAWGEALTGGGRFRSPEVEARIRLLADWLQAPAMKDLSPSRQGAFTLARVTEIRPLDDGNRRLARLAAAHAMVAAGGRAPVLVGADGDRLGHAVEEAVALSTEGLVGLLDEAAARALDVLLQSVGQGLK